MKSKIKHLLEKLFGVNSEEIIKMLYSMKYDFEDIDKFLKNCDKKQLYEVVQITYNWCVTELDGDRREDCGMFTVGMSYVTEIKEVELKVFDVFFSDGSKVRIFNPNSVKYNERKI